MNGENVILGQIYFVFSFLFNPTVRNIEDEREERRGVEEAEVGDGRLTEGFQRDVGCSRAQWVRGGENRRVDGGMDG